MEIVQETGKKAYRLFGVKIGDECLEKERFTYMDYSSWIAYIYTSNEGIEGKEITKVEFPYTAQGVRDWVSSCNQMILEEVEREREKEVGLILAGLLDELEERLESKYQEVEGSKNG